VWAGGWYLGKAVRERVANRSDAKLIDRVPLAEQLYRLLHTASLGLVVVQPCEDGSHQLRR
jgi:hypothetical protein